MYQLGTFHTLNVARVSDHGYFLQNPSTPDDPVVLLPYSLASRDLQTGENVRVFLYKDGDERLTATMQQPKITLNNMALLKVIDVNKYGAYLDWGLDKDLFVPYSEQTYDMVEGQTRLVYLYVDKETDRLVATEKIDRFLTNDPITVEENEEVDLWIWHKTDLGYNVIINEQHKGLIYHNEFYRDVHYGDQMTGYIKKSETTRRLM